MLLAAAAIAGPAPARADDIGHEQAMRLLEEGKIRPLEEILETVLQQVPGHVIETELEDSDGRLVYDFKIIRSGGRVQEVEIDAATGEILEIEDDD
jgi:uncharacterized membrane protein YkoI